MSFGGWGKRSECTVFKIPIRLEAQKPWNSPFTAQWSTVSHWAAACRSGTQSGERSFLFAAFRESGGMRENTRRCHRLFLCFFDFCHWFTLRLFNAAAQLWQAAAQAGVSSVCVCVCFSHMFTWAYVCSCVTVYTAAQLWLVVCVCVCVCVNCMSARLWVSGRSNLCYFKVPVISCLRASCLYDCTQTHR